MSPPLIAIVEDEEAVRKALGRLLRAAGLRTVTFPGCTAVLDFLSSHRPDCMIVDLHMPGVSGLELLREMPARGLDIPAIMITAHDEPGTRQCCLEAGAAVYLRKPLEDCALLDALAVALGGCPALRARPAA